MGGPESSCRTGLQERGGDPEVDAGRFQPETSRMGTY
jgi:hypothetical protein